MIHSSGLADAARGQATAPLASLFEGKTARTIDSKTIFGKNGKFKSSVPPGAVRPKPLPVPAKAK